RGVSEEKVLRCIEGRGEATESYGISGFTKRTSFSEIDPLISTLAERGVITREEFYETMFKRHSPAILRAAFDSLLDLLVSKGVINEEERRKLSE
ncbi:MAG TPA: hypothetical protein VKA97_14545, partial [Pyrinomonadaceae bacterium]|nr:hypothetical protein [Pyrinomonadaceae bacterium]